MVVRTLGSHCQTTMMAHNVPDEIKGIEFLISLYILKSSTLDLILGMDWLKAHTTATYCGPKVVHLFHPSGVMVNCTAPWVRRYMR